MATTGNASAQNNVVTAAEYQAAADEITAILAAQRAERAPIEAQQELLRNRQELLIARRQSALNTLQAAEAAPSETAFLEASRTAYARATGEVEAVNFAIQQNRSVLGQSLQASAELQDQRTNLEVKADFAERSPPNLNSLTPPATAAPNQAATYVAPPPPPIRPDVSPQLLSNEELLQIYPETDPQEIGAIRGTTIITDEARRIMSDPAMIQQQLAENAAAVSPVPPTTSTRALSNEETTRLFQEIDNPPAAANNRTTGAEYQAAADEITAIINAQRAERAPIEAQQEQLQNRREILIARQRSALNTLQAAEAAPSETAFLEQSRTAYARATGEVEATNFAIQQNRSVLAQSRQSTAELQDQRNNLEVKADFADRSPPNLNSLTPPATTEPGQPATYVAPPAPPIPPVVAAESQIESPTETIAASAQNNQLTKAEYQAAADEVFEIQTAARATSAQLADQVSQNQSAYTAADNQATALRREYLAAEAAGASSTELASLAADYEAQIELTTQLGQQLNQSESALATNQAYRQSLATQESYLSQQASQAAAGPPGLNSVPGPGTEVPDQSVSSVTEAQLPVARSFSAQATETITPADPQPSGLNNVTTAAEYQAAADEVFEIQSAARATSAQLADQVSQNQAAYTAADSRATQLRREYLAAEAAGASSTELASLAADYEAQIELTTQLGQQLDQSESALAANQAYRQSLSEQENYLALQASRAAAGPPGLNSVPGPGTEVPDQSVSAVTEQPPAAPLTFSSQDVSGSDDEALAAFENAQLAAQEGAAFAEPTPVPASGDDALQAIQDAEDAVLAAQEGLAFPPVENPEAVLASGDEALQAAEDAELAALAREEGIAFAEPLDVPASGDEALQAAEDAELAAQEGLGFPPIENPAPVGGDDALQAIQDAEAAALAREEGIAFQDPLPVAIQDAELAAIQQAEGQAIFGPAPVTGDPAYGGATTDEQAAINQAITGSAANSATAAKTANAQRQSTLQSRKNQPAAADWRVRLQLAPGANYLYAASDKESRGILAPLYDTDGVIFPYTPSIETGYKAKYATYDLIHSNYRGYFYQGSSVDEIQIKGTFTAQDTREAQYLLAVIHFFRSVTKMFYGQDSQAGTPPPLVYLSGLGQYQFNNHPCVVAMFNYSLPTDVDYIRADGFNNIGLNLENRRSLGSGPAPGGAVGTIQRLLTNGLSKGAEKKPPVPGPVTQNVTNQNSINSTYVPTKMEITVSLYPIQTRNQVSQQFSLSGFAQGRLLQGGFW